MHLQYRYHNSEIIPENVFDHIVGSITTLLKDTYIFFNFQTEWSKWDPTMYKNAIVVEILDLKSLSHKKFQVFLKKI